MYYEILQRMHSLLYNGFQFLKFCMRLDEIFQWRLPKNIVLKLNLLFFTSCFVPLRRAVLAHPNVWFFFFWKTSDSLIMKFLTNAEIFFTNTKKFLPVLFDICKVISCLLSSDTGLDLHSSSFSWDKTECVVTWEPLLMRGTEKVMK